MKMNHVRDAITRNLPPCPVCRAERGDPCRSPSNKTRAPHKERLTPEPLKSGQGSATL